MPGVAPDAQKALREDRGRGRKQAMLAAARALVPDSFYHGTSVDAALAIQSRGFKTSLSGTGSGTTLLGPGVYCTTSLEKAMGYAKHRQWGGVVLQLHCDLGRCKKLTVDDPLMTSWQEHGYDSAWAPQVRRPGSAVLQHCARGIF